MKRVDGSENFKGLNGRPAVALGNFDGVHLGHQELIRRARDAARSRGGISAVYTFEPHPVRILAPSQCPKLLTTLDQKLRHLARYGVDVAVVEPFNPEFAKLTAEEFFEGIIMERLDPTSIVAGYDFTFGLHRGGTIETLEELGQRHGVDVSIVPARFLGETLISSTVIRKMLRDRDVGEAARLIGRSYEIAGEVIPGRGLGRTLEAHTANIRSLNEIVPGDGVYITLTGVEGHDGLMPSVTSIGDNPTFPDARFSIETHILGAEMELMGRTISIHFLAFMRETLKFATIEELKAQIARDIEAAREHHAKRQSR